MTNDSWIDVVGFRHEVLHTGALHALLTFGTDERNSVRRAAASSLLEGAVGARKASPEGRAAGARRKCDLVVDVLTDDGEIQVAVETKVDSGWTRDQLEGERGDSQQVVLLALGMTALVADLVDLPSIGSMRVVGPDRLAKAIRSAKGDLPAWTGAYLEALEREARANEEARCLAPEGAWETSEEWRPEATGPREHWAYFGEVLSRLDDDRAKWERKTLISGPLMTRWCWWAKDELPSKAWTRTLAARTSSSWAWRAAGVA